MIRCEEPRFVIAGESPGFVDLVQLTIISSDMPQIVCLTRRGTKG